MEETYGERLEQFRRDLYYYITDEVDSTEEDKITFKNVVILDDREVTGLILNRYGDVGILDDINSCDVISDLSVDDLATIADALINNKRT